jgi:hypothetical protein
MGWVSPGKAPASRDASWPNFWGNQLASPRGKSVPSRSRRAAACCKMGGNGWVSPAMAQPCPVGGEEMRESRLARGRRCRVESHLVPRSGVACRGERIEQVEGRQCHLLLCDKMGWIGRGKEEVMPYRLVEGKQCRVLSGPDLFSAASGHLASCPVVPCRVLS